MSRKMSLNPVNCQLHFELVDLPTDRFLQAFLSSNSSRALPCCIHRVIDVQYVKHIRPYVSQQSSSEITQTSGAVCHC